MSTMRSTSYLDFFNHVQTHQHLSSSQTQPVIYNVFSTSNNNNKDPTPPPHTKWTTTFFQKLNNIHVHVHHGTIPEFFNFNSSPYELASSAITNTMTLSELVDTISQQSSNHHENNNGYDLLSGTDTHMFIREKISTHNNGVIPKYQELWNDCKDMIYKDLNSTNTLQRVGFWVSGKGLSSQMHWDVNGHHNLNYQIFGKKKVIMFSPLDTPYLYCMPARLSHLSRIDPRPGKFNLSTHPLFTHAKPLYFDLQPGDVLFIPAGWYHHFYHDGEYNVNVTAWFTSPQSGKKWAWKTFWVANPLEAWWFVLKFLFAIIFILPWILLKKKVKGNVKIKSY
jgi:hypothetical protein